MTSREPQEISLSPLNLRFSAGQSRYNCLGSFRLQGGCPLSLKVRVQVKITALSSPSLSALRKDTERQAFGWLAESWPPQEDKPVVTFLDITTPDTWGFAFCKGLIYVETRCPPSPESRAPKGACALALPSSVTRRGISRVVFTKGRCASNSNSRDTLQV